MVLIGRARVHALNEARDLMPRGDAWSRERRTVIDRLLAGISSPRATVEVRASDLIEESDPRTTTELLEDWERVLGLPDECMPESNSLSERRALVTARAVGLGGGSREDIIELARKAGFDITIEERVGTPFFAGLNACGDECGPGLESFVWAVQAPLTTIRQARTGQMRCGDSLAEFGNELLECIVRRVAPAHTLVQFEYAAACVLEVYDENGDPIRVVMSGPDVLVYDELGQAIRVTVVGGELVALDEDGDPVALPITCS